MTAENTADSVALPRAASLVRQPLQWITNPHPSVKDELDQRRSRMLSAMSLAVFVTAIAFFINQVVRNPDILNDMDAVLILGGILVVLGVYFINRTGRINLAAMVFIVTLTSVFVFVPLLVGASKEMLFFTMMPILLTAIFFSVTWTIRLSLGILITISVLGVAAEHDIIWPVQFLVITGSIVFVYVKHLQFQERLRTQELERINQWLRKSEEILEQRVEERTHELNAALQEAERANAVKSTFLSSMSHELRTPMNAIINFTKFVAKGSMGPLTKQQEETLNEVIDSAKHLLNLINDVLDMSKIESGSLQLFIEPNVDLNGILMKVEATGKMLLAEKPVELRTEIEADFPVITGDRQRILQILLNVLSNACKFTEEGRIDLRAHRDGDEVVISFKDTGPGIADEDQALVFEAFKQTSTGLRQGGGTGLGMPISRSLTEAHGGRLWLESELGKGSTFYVTLPMKSPVSEPDASFVA